MLGPLLSQMVDNASRLGLPYAGRTKASGPIKPCRAPRIENAASICSERHMYGQVLRSGSSGTTLSEARKTGAASLQARCFGAAKDFGNEGFQMEENLTGPKMVNSEGLTASCLCIDRTILKGEIVDHSGVIIVKGNVNSGAAIHADGDIIILGHLEGEAHAGRNGDTHSIIFALHLNPTIISIAGSIAHGHDIVGAKFGQTASLFSAGEIRIHKAPDRSFNYLSVENGDINVVKDQPVGDLKGGDKAWFGIDMNSMRKPSRVALFTGSYILIIGIALFLFPETLFGVFFDLKSIIREWIRVGAVLAVVFGVYYIGTALGDVKGCNGADSFYMSTVIGRVLIFLSFCWLAVTRAAPMSLVIVGAVNLIGALTMLKALHSQNVLHTSN